MFADTLTASAETFAMTDAVRRYSTLNRWFIFKRRTNARPAPPSAMPAPAAGITEVISEPVSELGKKVTLARPGDKSKPEDKSKEKPKSKLLSGLPEGTEADEDTEADAVEEKIEIKVAPAPESRSYFVSALNPDDMRLGATLADWPRYLALGAQVETVDLTNTGIRYPSVEAAIASARYQKASDKPDLGPQLFRIEGAIHQSFVKKRETLVPALLPKSIDDEINMVRLSSGSAKMKAYKATWNPDAWVAQKMEMYRAYLEQRFTTDGRFREMIQAIQAKGGEILFVNGTDTNELGVGVRKDGSLAGGDNKIGKLMQGLGL
jgi:hypothetical protein